MTEPLAVLALLAPALETLSAIYPGVITEVKVDVLAHQGTDDCLELRVLLLAYRYHKLGAVVRLRHDELDQMHDARYAESYAVEHLVGQLRAKLRDGPPAPPPPVLEATEA